MDRFRFIFWFILAVQNCGHVQAFNLQLFEETDYKGLIYESDTKDPVCVKLPQMTWGYVRSIINDECIVAYTNENCKEKNDEASKLPMGAYAELAEKKYRQLKKMKSFHMCDKSPPGERRLQLLTENSKRDGEPPGNDEVLVNINMKHGNNGCYNVPKSTKSKISHVNTFGRCVDLFNEENCHGKKMRIPANRSPLPFSLADEDFSGKVRSLRSCKNTRPSAALEAKIVEITVIPQVPGPIPIHMEMTSNTFLNNGNSRIQQDFMVTKTVQDVFVVELIPALQQMEKVYVSKNVLFHMDRNVPFSEKIRISLAKVIPDAYGQTLPVNASLPLENVYRKEETKTFTSTNRIDLKPCTMKNIDSHVKGMKGYCADYIVEYHVTTVGGYLSAPEIFNELREMGLEPKGILDDYTAIATGTGKVLMDVALQSVMTTTTKMIKGCKEGMSMTNATKPGESGEMPMMVESDEMHMGSEETSTEQEEEALAPIEGCGGIIRLGQGETEKEILLKLTKNELEPRKVCVWRIQPHYLQKTTSFKINLTELGFKPHSEKQGLVFSGHTRFAHELNMDHTENAIPDKTGEYKLRGNLLVILFFLTQKFDPATSGFRLKFTVGNENGEREVSKYTEQYPVSGENHQYHEIDAPDDLSTILIPPGPNHIRATASIHSTTEWDEFTKSGRFVNTSVTMETEQNLVLVVLHTSRKYKPASGDRKNKMEVQLRDMPLTQMPDNSNSMGSEVENTEPRGKCGESIVHDPQKEGWIFFKPRGSTAMKNARCMWTIRSAFVTHNYFEVEVLKRDFKPEKGKQEIILNGLNYFGDLNQSIPLEINKKYGIKAQILMVTFYTGDAIPTSSLGFTLRYVACNASDDRFHPQSYDVRFSHDGINSTELIDTPPKMFSTFFILPAYKNGDLIPSIVRLKSMTDGFHYFKIYSFNEYRWKLISNSDDWKRSIGSISWDKEFKNSDTMLIEHDSGYSKANLSIEVAWKEETMETLPEAQTPDGSNSMENAMENTEPDGICGESITKDEGVINFKLMGSSNEIKNARCVWTIRPNAEKKVRDFQVEILKRDFRPEKGKQEIIVNTLNFNEDSNDLIPMEINKKYEIRAEVLMITFYTGGATPTSSFGFKLRYAALNNTNSVAINGKSVDKRLSPDGMKSTEEAGFPMRQLSTFLILPAYKNGDLISSNVSVKSTISGDKGEFLDVYRFNEYRWEILSRSDDWKRITNLDRDFENSDTMLIVFNSGLKQTTSKFSIEVSLKDETAMEPLPEAQMPDGSNSTEEVVLPVSRDCGGLIYQTDDQPQGEIIYKVNGTLKGNEICVWTIVPFHRPAPVFFTIDVINMGFKQHRNKQGLVFSGHSLNGPHNPRDKIYEKKDIKPGKIGTYKWLPGSLLVIVFFTTKNFNATSSGFHLKYTATWKTDTLFVNRDSKHFRSGEHFSDYLQHDLQGASELTSILNFPGEYDNGTLIFTNNTEIKDDRFVMAYRFTNIAWSPISEFFKEYRLVRGSTSFYVKRRLTLITLHTASEYNETTADPKDTLELKLQKKPPEEPAETQTPDNSNSMGSAMENPEADEDCGESIYEDMGEINFQRMESAGMKSVRCVWTIRPNAESKFSNFKVELLERDFMPEKGKQEILVHGLSFNQNSKELLPMQINKKYDVKGEILIVTFYTGDATPSSKLGFKLRYAADRKYSVAGINDSSFDERLSHDGIESTREFGFEPRELSTFLIQPAYKDNKLTPSNINVKSNLSIDIGEVLELYRFNNYRWEAFSIFFKSGNWKRIENMEKTFENTDMMLIVFKSGNEQSTNEFSIEVGLKEETAMETLPETQMPDGSNSTMVSEFRRNKLNYVFDTFFDVNNDDAIDMNDFEEASENIARIRGHAQGDANYKDESDQLLSIWKKLKVFADTNKDNKVSREEWLTVWRELMNDEWKKLFMDFMFRLKDTSGDESIDVEEFTTFCQTSGIKMEESMKAFAKISNNGGTEIDIKAYENLWKEYFGSDDVTAPGNSIFGRVPDGSMTSTEEEEVLAPYTRCGGQIGLKEGETEKEIKYKYKRSKWEPDRLCVWRIKPHHLQNATSFKINLIQTEFTQNPAKQGLIFSGHTRFAYELNIDNTDEAIPDKTGEYKVRGNFLVIVFFIKDNDIPATSGFRLKFTTGNEYGERNVQYSQNYQIGRFAGDYQYHEIIQPDELTTILITPSDKYIRATISSEVDKKCCAYIMVYTFNTAREGYWTELAISGKFINSTATIETERTLVLVVLHTSRKYTPASGDRKNKMEVQLRDMPLTQMPDNSNSMGNEMENIESDGDCGESLTKDGGEINFQLMESTAMKNARCVWTIRPNAEKKFDTFEVEILERNFMPEKGKQEILVSGLSIYEDSEQLIRMEVNKKYKIRAEVLMVTFYTGDATPSSSLGFKLRYAAAKKRNAVGINGTSVDKRLSHHGMKSAEVTGFEPRELSTFLILPAYKDNVFVSSNVEVKLMFPLDMGEVFVVYMFSEYRWKMIPKSDDWKRIGNLDREFENSDTTFIVFNSGMKQSSNKLFIKIGLKEPNAMQGQSYCESPPPPGGHCGAPIRLKKGENSGEIRQEYLLPPHNTPRHCLWTIGPHPSENVTSFEVNVTALYFEDKNAPEFGLVIAGFTRFAPELSIPDIDEIIVYDTGVYTVRGSILVVFLNTYSSKSDTTVKVHLKYTLGHKFGSRVMLNTNVLNDAQVDDNSFVCYDLLGSSELTSVHILPQPYKSGDTFSAHYGVSSHITEECCAYIMVYHFDYHINKWIAETESQDGKRFVHGRRTFPVPDSPILLMLHSNENFQQPGNEEVYVYFQL